MLIYKYINVFKIILSYWLSKILKKPIVWGLPFAISIESTTKCNLSCPECVSGTNSFERPTGNMTFSLFKKIIDKIKKHTLYLTLNFQGEPLINPNIDKMIKYATKKNILTVISTNAHFLDNKMAINILNSKLHKLIISLDGTNETEYQKYRVGGNYNLVINNIIEIVKLKQKLKLNRPKIIIQFLVFKHNQNKVSDIYKIAKQIGVDGVVIKTAQINNLNDNNNLIPTINKFSRYRWLKSKKYSIKSNFPNYCKRIWFYSIISWDGKVIPCCFDKNAKYEMGNINNQGFSEIWVNEKYQKYRKTILTNRKSIDICINCSEGLD